MTGTDQASTALLNLTPWAWGLYIVSGALAVGIFGWAVLTLAGVAWDAARLARRKWCRRMQLAAAVAAVDERTQTLPFAAAVYAADERTMQLPLGELVELPPWAGMQPAPGDRWMALAGFAGAVHIIPAGPFAGLGALDPDPDL